MIHSDPGSALMQLYSPLQQYRVIKLLEILGKSSGRWARPRNLLPNDRYYSWNFLFPDATHYAHYVFNTIKHNQTGKISFEVSGSVKN